MYAKILDGEIIDTGYPPRIERTPERDWDLRDPATREARGWFEVLETERPADTDTGTYISDIQMVDGIPTRVWIYRDWTPEETATRNAPTLEDKLHDIVATIAAVEEVPLRDDMKESLAAIQAKTVRTPEEQQTLDILQKDVAANEYVIRDAINKLATLLGDNTTAGSIREWRSTVTNTYDAATIKALADILIMQARQTRRIARQTLRLARLVTKDYSPVDVGTDI